MIVQHTAVRKRLWPWTLLSGKSSSWCRAAECKSSYSASWTSARMSHNVDSEGVNAKLCCGVTSMSWKWPFVVVLKVTRQRSYCLLRTQSLSRLLAKALALVHPTGWRLMRATLNRGDSRMLKSWDHSLWGKWSVVGGERGSIYIAACAAISQDAVMAWEIDLLIGPKYDNGNCGASACLTMIGLCTDNEWESESAVQLLGNAELPNFDDFERN